MTDFSAQVALGEKLTPVGNLHFIRSGPRQFSTFAYDPAWAQSSQAFSIEPALALDGGPFHTSGKPGHMRDALPGVFSDAAPDDCRQFLREVGVFRKPRQGSRACLCSRAIRRHPGALIGQQTLEQSVDRRIPLRVEQRTA